MKTLKIYVNLEKLEEIHHPFQKNTLNPDLGNFLYDECRGKEKKAKIDIHILTEKEFDSEKKEYIRNLIHKHFQEEKKEMELKRQISQQFYLFLLLLGLIFLLLSFFFSSPFVEEVFVILGWIAIWESVENFLFSKSKESLKVQRLKKLAEARIYFKEEIEEELS